MFNRVSRIVEENSLIYIDRTDYSIIHGDPSRSNIFYKRGEVKLVDWEFVRYDLREWDLAFFVWSNDLNKDLKKKKDFLNHAYCNYEGREKEFECIYLLHCMGILSWKLQRLSLYYKGGLDQRQKNSSEEEIIDGIIEDIPEIEVTLQKLQKFTILQCL